MDKLKIFKFSDLTPEGREVSVVAKTVDEAKIFLQKQEYPYGWYRFDKEYIEIDIKEGSIF